MSHSIRKRFAAGSANLFALFAAKFSTSLISKVSCGKTTKKRHFHIFGWLRVFAAQEVLASFLVRLFVTVDDPFLRKRTFVTVRRISSRAKKTIEDLHWLTRHKKREQLFSS